MKIAQKTLIITTVIVLLTIIGGVVWFFYFADTGTPGEGDSNRNPIINFFFPASDSDRSGGDQGRATTTDSDPSGVPIIRNISGEPVAGYTVFTRANETEEGSETTVIRYIERATGHIYETNTQTLTKERITNTTLPRIQEAHWLADPDTLFIRYLGEDTAVVNTFAGKITLQENTEEEDVGEQGEGIVAGEFFPQGISEISISPDGERIFTLSENQSGSIGLTMSPDGADAVEVFNTPSAAWNAAWPSENTLAFTTEPSREAFGFLYYLNPTQGTFTKVLGDIPGLTTNVSPDTDTIIYTEGFRNTIQTFSFDRDSGERTRFPVQTLPEKCVWSTEEELVVYCAVPQDIPESRYPDVWYQGAVSFNDALWRVNITAGIAELVYLPEEHEFDMIKPRLTENDAFFFFVDKKTGDLWSIDLTAVQ